MNAPFIHDDLLLSTPLACSLYHDVAAGLPIIDYHGHLDPAAIAEDRRFDTLTELWIDPDPYKHRAMRVLGIPEADITGGGDARTRFDRWAAAVPRLLGNPLYHWTALELKRVFDIDELLSPDTADAIWAEANRRLAGPGFSARALLGKANVECVCTCDRLLDDLGPHRTLADEEGTVRVLPSLRGDDALQFDPVWLDQLTGADRSFGAFRAAIADRLDAFDALGCRLADHGLDAAAYLATDDDATASLYQRHRAEGDLDDNDRLRLRSGLMRLLASQYAQRGWALQLHVGALRHTSSRLRRLAGPTGGYATIGPPLDVAGLARLLDDLEQRDRLPRVILYNLNPADNAALATLTGSFAQDGVAGKLQFGPAWWFNDHPLGITRQLEALASHSLLSTFVGMTTDSRSLLSMTRHETFRRVFCDWLARHVIAGTMPPDRSLLDPLVGRVCHDNAAEFLQLPSRKHHD